MRSEVGLSKEYTVCDNISLETIIIEYEIFYHQRFKIYPQLCKTIDIQIPAKSIKRSTCERKKHAINEGQSDLNLSDFISSSKFSKNDTRIVEPTLEASDETMTALTEYHDFILQVK